MTPLNQGHIKGTTRQPCLSQGGKAKTKEKEQGKKKEEREENGSTAVRAVLGTSLPRTVSLCLESMRSISTSIQATYLQPIGQRCVLRG